MAENAPCVRPQQNLPILLDWDGVIVDSLGIYLELFEHLCQRYQKPFSIRDAEGFRDWYQPRWERNFLELGFTMAQYREICEYYPAVLDYRKAPLFVGLKPLLARLSREHPLIVMSTAPTASISRRLEEEGLLGHFQSVNGSDDGSTDKIEKIRAVMRSYEGGQGVMIGDTDLDIEAGQANGLQTIGVTYGWISKARVEAANPGFLVESPDQLSSVVDRCLHSLRCNL